MTALFEANSSRRVMARASSRKLSTAAVRLCFLTILALPANDCPAEEPVSFKEQFHFPVPAISPDGQQLLLVAYERLSLADPSTGKILRSNRRNAPERARAVWFPDGQRILTYGPALQVWDAKTLGELSTTPGSGLAVSAAIAPDGETVSVGLDVGDIQLYDTTTWKVLRTFKGHRAPVSALVWNKRADQLFSAGGFGGGFGDPTIHVWNPQTGKSLRSFQADTRQVAAIALSPDEKWLASQGKGDNLSLWDPSTGRKLRDIPGTSVAACVAISPDGRTIASSHDNDVILWSAEGRQLKKLQGHGDWVKHIEFSSDGRLLVTGGGDSTLVWKLDAAIEDPRAYSRSGQEAVSLSAGNADVHSVSFSPNGRWLAAGVDTGPAAHVYVWDAETLELHAKVPTGAGPPIDAHFRPDSKLLFQHSKGDVIVWEAGRQREMRALKIDDGDSGFGMSRGPGHKLAIGNRNGELVIADGRTGNTIRRILAHKEPVKWADITANGKFAATGSHDDTACIWDVETGKRIDTLPKQRGSYQVVRFSPDGTVLAGGSEDALVLWDVAGHKLKHLLPGHASYTRSLSFSHDGKWLVTGGDDKLVKVWDVASGKLLGSLAGHTDGVFGVAFSPDRKRIASGSFDKTVKLWDVTALNEAE